MQRFHLLPINNILESVYYKHIYNPKHIKYKSLYYHTRGDVKGKLSDDDIAMIKLLNIIMFLILLYLSFHLGNCSINI